MTDDEWAKFLKYASPKSILVLTWSNKIVELQCPFSVELKYDFDRYRKGERVTVDLVKLSNSLITVFIINEEPFYYYHFFIIVE